MIEENEVEIGAHHYRIKHLGAKKARGIQVILAHLLGPALDAGSEHADMLKKSARKTREGEEQPEEEKEGYGALAMKAMAAGLGALNETEFDRLCDTFAETTTVFIQVGNAEPQWVRLSQWYDMHFANNYGEQTSWLVECIRYNFASLFQGAAFKNLAAAFASKSPHTSTG